MKSKIPIYLSKIIKKYPAILSGRKNIKESHERIIKTKKLINKFISKKNKVR
tara:strand:- start:747 stop:902 length:156 start_codon:yes stop_codon:yes gene_type:complete